MVKKKLFLAFVVFSLVFSNVLTGQNRITEKNIKFIEYPDFPEAHSSWCSIGYNPKYNTVHAGITNHKDKVALYEYNASKDEIKLDGFINDMVNLRDFQWQGKIHSKIVFDHNGMMYFSTDGGESRQEYLMNHPHGYGGGFFMKWNPDNRLLTNLGMGMRNESVKDLDIDPEAGILYGISYPQGLFFVYNFAENELINLGRLASTHIPRHIFTDQWQNCYYVDWRQRLVKYEKSRKEFVFAKESLPAFPGTPGSKIVTGICSYAKDKANGIIYLTTYGGKVLAFKPSKEGIGQVTDLGGLLNTESGKEWVPYAYNLNIGNNGKLYYFLGGHGYFTKPNTSVFVEFDPHTGKNEILYEFHISEMEEATGFDVKDKEGNIYFLGRRRTSRGDAQGVKEDPNDPSTQGNRPFLIKFNPEKEVIR